MAVQSYKDIVSEILNIKMVRLCDTKIMIH